MKRRAFQRSARNALLWGLASFAVAQLALVIAIDQWLPYFRDPWYGPKLLRLEKLLAQDDRSPQENVQSRLVLMLGSSYTGNALNGVRVEQDLSRELGARCTVYNFGVPGAGPLVEMLNFERLLAAGIKPDLVLLEVFPIFISSRNEESQRLPPDRLEFSDLARLDRCHYPTSELRQDYWESLLVPCHAHRYGILNALASVLLPCHLRQTWGWHCDDWGWLPSPPPVPETHQQVLDSLGPGFQSALRDYQLSSTACEAICQVLDHCRQNQIRTGLILMPEKSPCHCWYPQTTEEQIQGFLKHLHEQFGSAIVDARTWVPDEEFWDYNHMMAGGSNIFTDRLYREMLLPAMRGQLSEPHANPSNYLSRR